MLTFLNKKKMAEEKTYNQKIIDWLDLIIELKSQDKKQKVKLG